MRVGAQLSHAQALSLIKPVSQEEVVNALQSIDDTKVPRLDGFSSLFFQKCWQMVKHDIIVAVYEFFFDDISISPVNITATTLVPKVFNASHVREFRPISCCTIVYKIIAKILTIRLERVIGNIMDMAQSGFIPRKCIIDNVLLASAPIKGYSWASISPRYILNVDMAKAYDSIEWDSFSALGFWAHLRVFLGFHQCYIPCWCSGEE